MSRVTDIALKDVSNVVAGSIHYTLDNAGNRLKEETKDPSGTIKRTVQRTFDALGQLATTINADYLGTPHLCGGCYE